MNKKYILFLASFFVGNVCFGFVESNDMDNAMPPAPEACYSRDMEKMHKKRMGCEMKPIFNYGIDYSEMPFNSRKCGTDCANEYSGGKFTATWDVGNSDPVITSAEFYPSQGKIVTQEMVEAPVLEAVVENADSSNDVVLDSPVAIADIPTVNLNDFSNKFLDDCPDFISQVSWINNLLLPLQMLTDVALATTSATKEDKENMMITLTENCMAQGSLFLTETVALDPEVSRDLKEQVDRVCMAYIKRVTDSIVADDIHAGDAEEVLDMIQDIEESIPSAA